MSLIWIKKNHRIFSYHSIPFQKCPLGIKCEWSHNHSICLVCITAVLVHWPLHNNSMFAISLVDHGAINFDKFKFDTVSVILSITRWYLGKNSYNVGYSLIIKHIFSTWLRGCVIMLKVEKSWWILWNVYCLVNKLTKVVGNKQVLSNRHQVKIKSLEELQWSFSFRHLLHDANFRGLCVLILLIDLDRIHSRTRKYHCDLDWISIKHQ